MKISAEIINDIADNLEMGFTCYVNKDTNQLVAFPAEVDIYLDEDNEELFELEPWHEEAKIIKAAPDSFVKIEQMTSTESFRIMEDFIETIDDEDLQRKLLYAIQMRKPFAHFKEEINNAGEAERERWFAFKRERMIEYIKDQMGIGQ
jgi:hypothetical protein